MRHFSFSTQLGSALGKLKMTCGWKSRPANAVAGRPGPSLAGGVATHRSKRRQGSCGGRAESPERVKVVEAEAVPVAEGSMCAVAKRDGDAPPGSQAASRTKGHHRDPGDPIGAVEVVSDGGKARGQTGVPYRAEVGGRTGP